MRSHDFTSEKRRLNHWFEQQGLERVARQLNTGGLLGRARTEAWMRDSLLWSIEEFEAGHAVYAFRGYAQACGYAGELGGWGYEQDTRTALHNALEDAISSADREREELEQVLQDKWEERGGDVFVFQTTTTREAFAQLGGGQGTRGAVRARSLDAAKEIVREHLDRIFGAESQYEFELFRMGSREILSTLFTPDARIRVGLR